MNQTPNNGVLQKPKDLVIPTLIISIPMVAIALALDYASTYVFVEYLKPLGKGPIDQEGINTLIAMFSVIAFPISFIGAYIATKFIDGTFTAASIKNLAYYCSAAIVVSLALYSSPFVLGGFGYSIFLLPSLLKRWLTHKTIEEPLQTNHNTPL